ncbi:hypothetical protein [Polaromonas sp. UBA4122]|uniref:hypothetical protein n=1 Tax=Polaromonas sp. UBA4122 TaxID=1947074 RepID=UPI0025F7100B|nr:hypothetical protein [Polaromonas sp. UBA4122]
MTSVLVDVAVTTASRACQMAGRDPASVGPHHHMDAEVQARMDGIFEALGL